VRQGKHVRIPEGRADLEQLWREAEPLQPTNLPAWVSPEYANTYRYLGFTSWANLPEHERKAYFAEFEALEAAGLIVDQDDDRCVHHLYVTAPKISFYVDENHDLSIEERASMKLTSRNDTRFLRGRQGVIEVDLARWQEAQRYERRSWMEGNGLSEREDRNSTHEKMFDYYAAIRGRYFDSAIEIGCGPFTNMVHILKQVRCGKLTLLDPLINDYLTHPHCTYRDRRMGEVEVSTVSEPVESFSMYQKFDLVVMINVLEHCFSVPKVFERILSFMVPGGVLIFHDKFLPLSDVEEFFRTSYDAGHPLRVVGEVISEFLADNYEELFSRRAAIPIEVYTFDSIYFIGRKR
jgi:SAM-dependent methyltransferase